MEQQLNAPVSKVFALLTDPKWLEQRSLALGELSASVRAKKSGGLVQLTMNRRVRRELPSIVARLLSPESDLVFEESWSAEKAGARSGSLAMDAVGQPVRMTANFELEPAGKGCVYRITHKCKSTVPLIGGVVEKFTLGEVEKGCAEELAYLVEQIKKSRGAKDSG